VTPATSMREKIARAILRARFYDIEPHMYDSLEAFFAEIDEEHIASSQAEADAALDAIMEPTPAMCAAGYVKITQRSEYDDGDMPEVFRAMILAAKEGK
jgi:hypothetical protein